MVLGVINCRNSINNMNIELSDKNYLKKNMLRSLVLNILVMAFGVLFFEPTIKSDDYDLSMVLYGAVDGEYSNITMYCLVFFGEVIKCLLTIAPHIPWYAVVNYIIVFFSLLIISIIMRRHRNECLVFEIIVLPFLAYELYIRLTFTKTAGITIISGLLLLLYLIDCSSKKIVVYGAALVWVLLGVSIRPSMLNLVLEIFFSAFVISIILVNGKKKKAMIIKFILYVLVLLSLGKILVYISSNIREKDSDWAVYSQYNSARAKLQDYHMLEYKGREEEYNKAGLSENDYIAFKNWALYTDYDFFTIKRLNNISSITEESPKENPINRAIKNLCLYYFSETGFYFLFLITLLFCCSTGLQRKNKCVIVVSVVVYSFFAYIYMSYLGRTQHHVDLSVMISAMILIMYYYYRFDCHINNISRALLSAVVIIVVFLFRFSSSLSRASYYANDVENQKEYYNNNKRIMDLLSNDKEHIYVFCPLTTNTFYDCIFEPFEIIPKGYYSNLEMTNRYGIPTWDSIAAQYGINNYFKEATDSEIIYFVDLDSNEGWINVVQTYINEHYCSSAKYELVKELGSVNIYRFVGEANE